MKESRNKKIRLNNNYVEEKDKIKDSVNEKDVDLDNVAQKNNDYEEGDDLSDDSSLFDEIEEKINSINVRNKNISIEGDDNINFKNNEKKNQQKYDKTVTKNHFNDYFDSHNNIKDDYYEVNYPQLNKYELKIDSYSDLFKLISKKEIFKTLFNYTDKNRDEKENGINDGNLFRLMYDLLTHNYNIFLYGFGNKMNFVLDFLGYYRDHYYNDCNIPLYVVSCNLNTPEMNMKVILNKIQDCIKFEFEKYYGKNYEQFATESNVEGNIEKFMKIYNKIKDKLDNEGQNNKEISKNEITKKNSDIDLLNDEENEDDDSEQNDKESMDDMKDLEEIKYPFQILLVIHNIGSLQGQNKAFHEHLSDLVKKLYFLKLLVTCENLLIPYFWTLEVKDKYKFCYLKFHTFQPYDSEIDENYSIKIGNNIKEGYGLKEIFSSFTDVQKRLIKEIAILNLKGDHDNLTPKGLVNYFVETGIGVVTDIQKLEDLIKEAIDHNIVELKVSNENNKEIYKMILERNVIEKIAEGGFM